jgi:hypothetical protein
MKGNKEAWNSYLQKSAIEKRDSESELKKYNFFSDILLRVKRWIWFR